jgi:hypothetical protein
MSTDCGCGGSSAASGGQRSTGYRSSAGKPARPGSVVSAHDRPTQAPAGSNGPTQTDFVAGAGDGPGPVGAGPIVRLNPTDGLFLKSAHLDQIQDYARALSLAVGLGTGTGVVYGYGLELSSSALTASAGLAINPSGHPLQTSEMLRISVASDDLPALDPDGFWVVEISPDEDTTGSENAYGAVCADPCEGVGSIAPWTRSLVRIRLRPDVLPDLDGHPHECRNWLASAYFERERRRGQPWLVPGERLPGAPGTVAPLNSRPWAETGTAPGETAVPLGVLLRIGSELVLDTWTARREVGGPPAERRWDGHLARRSWPVFLAQVLQFQDQLRSESLASAAVDKRVVVDHRAEAVEKYIASIPTAVANWESFKELKAGWFETEEPYEVSVRGKNLPDVGITELPPAGYLGFNIEDEKGRAQVSRIFSKGVDLRFCEVRADYVAGAVQAAQHLDRIPLDPASYPRPQVDILVPSLSADLDGLKTDAYNWVAFVRRSTADCGDQPPDQPKTEDVEVADAFMAFDDGQEKMSKGDRPDSTSLAVVQFAENAADVPAAAAKPSELDTVELLGIVGAASTEDAAKLAVRRADALRVAWNLGSLDIEPAFDPHFVRPLIMVFVGRPEPLTPLP